jgi:hypothetical protein
MRWDEVTSMLDHFAPRDGRDLNVKGFACYSFNPCKQVGKGRIEALERLPARAAPWLCVGIKLPIDLEGFGFELLTLTGVESERGTKNRRRKKPLHHGATTQYGPLQPQGRFPAKFHPNLIANGHPGCRHWNRGLAALCAHPGKGYKPTHRFEVNHRVSIKQLARDILDAQLNRGVATMRECWWALGPE